MAFPFLFLRRAKPVLMSEGIASQYRSPVGSYEAARISAIYSRARMIFEVLQKSLNGLCIAKI